MNEWNNTGRDEFWQNRLSNSPILKKLPNSMKSDWNTASLNAVDQFLYEYCKEITCPDVAAIYWKFWYDLKKIKSNSTNFVGYSEFLVLRSLLHLLRRDYFPNKSTEFYSRPFEDSPNNDIGYFAFEKNKLFVTTECIPKLFKKDLQNRRPDIVLYRSSPKPELLGVVQVKAFPASAANVKKDLVFFDSLKKYTRYKKTRTLITIMAGCSRLTDNRLCKLADVETPIAEIFRIKLGLDWIMDKEGVSLFRKLK